MPLRVRLTLYYTLFFSLALLGGGTGLFLLTRRVLLTTVVNELRVGSALVQKAYGDNRNQLHGSADLDVQSLWSPDLHALQVPDLFVQVVDPAGTPLVRSTNLGGDSLPLSAAERNQALAGHAITPTEFIGTTRVQSLVVPLRVNNAVVGVIQVAQSLRTTDQALQTLVWALLGGGAVAVLAAAGGGMWLARSALAPIDYVTATVATILRAQDLHRRVPPSPTNDELDRLTRTVNDMLARVERVVDAQQRFMADVAHELRTPLAAMRGNLELLRRGAINDSVLRAESLHDMESEVLRLGRMANDLLVLAQADAGMPLRMDMVPLDELLAEVYRDTRALADGVALRIMLDDAVVIAGDRDRLKQALLNLVANALAHTPPVGSVTLELRHVDDHVHLAVHDTGSGIPPDQQATIFDRFVRGDRSRTRGGAGLGLAIAKWIVEAHGGHMLLHSAAGQGSTFTIVLPLLPAPSTPTANTAPTDAPERPYPVATSSLPPAPR